MGSDVVASSVILLSSSSTAWPMHEPRIRPRSRSVKIHKLQATTGHAPRSLPFCTKCGRPQSRLSQGCREAAGRNGQSAAPACRASLEAGQTLPDGVLHEVGDLVQIQLVHDVAAVRLYGLAAEAEQPGDVLVGVALGDEIGDLALSCRELVGGSVRGGVVHALQVVVQHRLEGCLLYTS